MQKIEYNITKIDDFLEMPLNVFLRWLAPSTYELSDYRFELLVNQLQQEKELPIENQIQRVDELAAMWKVVYQNEYLGFLKPYFTLPVKEFFSELSRLVRLSKKNDFIFRDLPDKERQIVMSVLESKRGKKLIEGKGNLGDLAWLYWSVNRFSKLDSWSKKHIGAGIGTFNFNLKKFGIFYLQLRFNKNANGVELLQDLASSMFGEVIIKIAEYEKIQEVYPKLIALIKEQEATSKIVSSSTQDILPITKWKKNKVEFYQLIYALHSADYIDGEVTNLVEQLANIFGIELAKSWQSGLNHNINANNNDYEPRIFDDLKKGYFDYVKRVSLDKKSRNS